jgi:flagellar biosynthetic protein FliQ
MTTDQAIELSRQAVMMGFLIGAPVMLTAIVVGLVISILQAVTQIQDQTLSFVPKIVAMFLALVYLLPWILHHMTEYSTRVIRDIPGGF